MFTDHSFVRICIGASCLLLAATATVSAAPVTVGLYSDIADQQVVFNYNTAAPLVVFGTGGSPTAMDYDGGNGPLLKVYQVGGTAEYHHVNIREHYVVAGANDVFDMQMKLMIFSGGVWVPSGNYDDLWFSARGGVTPDPVIDPVPTSFECLNRPEDVLTIDWTGSVPVGDEIDLDFWVTVPASMTTFGIYQYTTVAPDVPEPATMALLGIGLGLLGLRRRRPAA